MKLADLRERIDAIDNELLSLASARLALALRTRRHKESIEDPQREAAVLAAAGRERGGLLAPEFARRLVEALMAEGKRLQHEGRPLIAFQGEHGAFSELAALRMAPDALPLPYPEFADVFDAVSSGECALGAVPVENSLEGTVTQVNEILAETELKVVGEALVPIRHCLVAPPGTDHREIGVVYSHPQALAQCRGFLRRNKLEGRPYYDTAGAARMVSRERPPAAAAIASARAADLHGLGIIKEGIEDAPSNRTRFLLVAKEAIPGGDKCSVVFATAHRAGALAEVLDLFAADRINLTRIASIPRRSDPGNYTFFLDFEGSADDPAVARALNRLAERTVSRSFLGCYAMDRS